TSPGVNESHCGEQCFGRVVRLSDIAGMINSIGFENFKIMSCEQKEQSLATQIGRIRRKAILSTSERAEASQIAKSWQSIQEDKLDDNELKRLVDHLDIQKRGQKSYKEWREKLLIVAAEAGQEIQNEHRKRLTHLTTSTISGVPAGILLASGVSAPFSLGVSAGIAGIYAASRYGWRLYKRQGQLDRNDNFEDWKSQIGKDLGASAKFVGKSWEGIRSAAGKTRDAANRFRGGSTKGDDSNSNAYKEGEEPIPKSVTQIDIDTERHRYDILRQEYGELYKATVDKRGDPELMEMRERMSALKKRLTTLELTFKAQEEKSKQVPIYKKVAGWTLKNAGLPSLVGGATIFIVPGWKIGAALGGFWLTKNIYRSISDKITGNKPRK
ncbi:hypothetical protein HOF17_00210, partial [Candidatus Peribacteria bacterium]|nr:hypothetical protein [Candidatus Peribacteria bacterium]